MNPKISVIIPAYNAEKTLRRCLDSVFASDFLDSMEIILVNDGSKDGTLKVAEEYKKHPNFVLIDQPNGGVARARWAGISASRGEYLGFVDADDYIAPDMMSKMYGKVMETGAEIVVCGWHRVSNGSMCSILPHKEMEENGIQAEERMILKNEGITSLWNKIIHKSLINAEEYQQTLEIVNSEDTLLLAKILFSTNKVSYLHAALYYYIENVESATMKPSLRSLRDYFYVQQILFQIFLTSEYVLFKKLAYSFYVRKVLSGIRIINRIDNINMKILNKKVIQELNQISTITIFKTAGIRLAFDLVLVKIGIYGCFYSLWESPFFSSIRENCHRKN